MDGWMDGLWTRVPGFHSVLCSQLTSPHGCEFYGCVWDGIKMDEWESGGDLVLGARWVTPALRFLSITFEGVTLEITGWLIVEPTYLTPPPNPAESEKVRDATRAMYNYIIVALPQKPLSSQIHMQRVCFTISYSIVFCFTKILFKCFPHKPNSYAECPLCRFLIQLMISDNTKILYSVKHLPSQHFLIQ
jgi:hypothetical protein